MMIHVDYQIYFPAKLSSHTLSFFFFFTCVLPLLPYSYIYSGSLPSGASESLVRELMAAILSNPKLSQLVDLCKAFIGSYDLKQREYKLLKRDIPIHVHLSQPIPNLKLYRHLCSYLGQYVYEMYICTAIQVCSN